MTFFSWLRYAFFKLWSQKLGKFVHEKISCKASKLFRHKILRKSEQHAFPWALLNSVITEVQKEPQFCRQTQRQLNPVTKVRVKSGLSVLILISNFPVDELPVPLLFARGCEGKGTIAGMLLYSISTAWACSWDLWLWLWFENLQRLFVT